MYKLIILTVALLATAQARPDASDALAETRDFKSDVREDGSYSYQYQTSNGIAAQESGVGGQYSSGSSAYYAPDGQLIQLTYTADENGYHPSGAHLPTPPPIPAAILKALEYIRTHPHQEERQGGAVHAAQRVQYVQPVQHHHQQQQQHHQRRPFKF